MLENIPKLLSVIGNVWSHWDLISQSLTDSKKFKEAFDRFDWDNQSETQYALLDIINLPSFAIAVSKTDTTFDDELLGYCKEFLGNSDLFGLCWKLAHKELTVLDVTRMLAGGLYDKIVNLLPSDNILAAKCKEEQDPEFGIITILGIVSLGYQILKFIKERKQ